MLNSPGFEEVRAVEGKKLEMAEILMPHSQTGPIQVTKYCAIDCEMDKSNESSVVIKISLVNE